MSIEKFRETIAYYYNSPVDILQASIDCVDRAVEGKIELSDPNNPLVLLMEMSATMSANAIAENAIGLRKVFPKLAMNVDDLNNHVSDFDTAGYFSTPCKNVKLGVLLAKDSFNDFAVNDSVSGNSKLVIPANTRWIADGVHYYSHYPITIKKLPHGEYQALYDLSDQNEIFMPDSNVIKTMLTNIKGTTYIHLTVPVEQLSVRSEQYSVSSSSGFSVDSLFSDNFYHARVYSLNTDNYWEEISVTLTKQVYDQNTPTAILTVGTGTVNVKIPDIYFTNNKVGETIRIDIYSTKGAIDQQLTNLPGEAFSVNWNNFGNKDSKFVAPLAKFPYVGIYGITDAIGGKDEVSFEEKRERVIYGNGAKTPIVYSEVENKASAHGFKLSKLYENVMGSKYLASSSIGNLGLLSTVSGLGCAHATVDIDYLRSDTPKSIIFNGNRTTIKPSALFHRDGGNITLLPDSASENLKNLSVDSRVRHMNASNYLFNPFYTVMDEGNNTFSVRTYDLASPVINSRTFVKDQPAIGYSVTTEDISIKLTDNGFKFTVYANVPKNLTNLHLQLIFTGSTLERWTCSAAQQIVSPTTSMFVFNVETNFDITNTNAIQITNLVNMNGVEGSVLVPITSDIDLVYLVETESGISDLLTSVYAGHYYDEVVVGITHERANCSLGVFMENYYTEGRAIATTPKYRTYAENVYRTYERNEYLYDENGIALEEVDGVLSPIITHNRGDVVLDDNGDPEIMFAKGSIILDENGLGEELEPSRLIRELTFPLYDAKLLYCTDTNCVSYLKAFREHIVALISDDIGSLNNKSSESTVIPYAPTNNYGSAMARISNTGKALVDTSIGFTITVVITESGYYNSELRDLIGTQIIEKINEVITTGVYTSGLLYPSIMAMMPEEVIGVSLESGISDYTYLTLQGTTSNFMLSSKMLLKTDGTVSLIDDVEIKFTLA